MSTAETAAITRSNGWIGELAVVDVPDDDAITVTIAAVEGKSIVIGSIFHADTAGTGAAVLTISSGGVEIYTEVPILGTDALAANVQPIAGAVGEAVIVLFTTATTLTAGYMHVSYKIT